MRLRTSATSQIIGKQWLSIEKALRAGSLASRRLPSIGETSLSNTFGILADFPRSPPASVNCGTLDRVARKEDQPLFSIIIIAVWGLSIYSPLHINGS